MLAHKNKKPNWAQKLLWQNNDSALLLSEILK